MTKETRTTFEPSDVKAVELQCNRCGFRAVWPLNKWTRDYVKCINCGESWPLQQNAAHEALNSIVRSHDHLAAVDSSKLPFKIRFEIESEKDKL